MTRPNVLFLVHGIGEQRGGWSEFPIQTLTNAAKTYDCFPNTANPLEDEIEFVEIRYDDIFDTILERFQNLTAQFELVDQALQPGALTKTLDALKDTSGLGARYAGDVVLYQLKLVSVTVLLRVMNRITETVARIGRVDDQGQPIKYGILGHSMGTTVVHDALQLLATQPMITTDAILQQLKQALPNLADDYVQQFGNNPFSAQNFQFDAVYMVSNTSRLLHTTKSGPYDSLVRPFNLQNTTAVCRSFYNIDHIWDPVSKVKRFQLDKAWGGNTDNALQINVNHVYDKNIHALDHYLLNPEVQAAIFFQMAPSFKATQLREARKRVADGSFQRWGPGFEPDAKKQEIQQLLEAKVADAVGSENIDKVKQLLEQLKVLRGN